mmetsp:Transcript_6427/g.10035  ORF Transcript_6427/g.10035 Transcript_6427/m.10035 type:complete len:220 (+) Transcript_6427:284-943(+)
MDDGKTQTTGGSSVRPSNASSLYYHLGLASSLVESEVHLFVLSNGVHLGQHGSSGRLLFGTIIGSLGSFGLVGEELDKGSLHWVACCLAALARQFGHGRVQSSLLHLIVGGEFFHDCSSRFRHHCQLGLFVGRLFFDGDHVEHFFHLCLEVVLRLDLSSLVQFGIGGFCQVVNVLVVTDNVFCEFHVLDSFFQFGNDLIFGFVLRLEHGIGFLLERIGN